MTPEFTIALLLGYTLGFLWGKFPNTGDIVFEFLRFAGLAAILAIMLSTAYGG